MAEDCKPLSKPRCEVIARMSDARNGSIRSASVSPSVRRGLVELGIACERRYGDGLYLELTNSGIEIARAVVGGPRRQRWM